MRITIKSMQEKLDQANADKQRYYDLWREAEAKEKNRESKLQWETDIYNEHSRREMENLTYIVKALINPDILMEEYKARFNIK